MNYIKQIRHFWKIARRHSLTSGEIAMYLYLLECSNVLDWENPVVEPNSTLQRALGVKSFNTICTYRNRLQQYGLLKFITRSGSEMVKYQLFDVEAPTSSKFERVPDKVVDEVPDEVTDKVVEKVADEVGNSVLLNNKQKQNLNQHQQQQHAHQIFAKKLFSENGELEKENLELQLNQRRLLTPEDTAAFNRHLQTEGKSHIHWSEYTSHLRNWLNTNTTKEKFSARKEKGSRKQTPTDILRLNQLVSDEFSND